MGVGLKVPEGTSWLLNWNVGKTYARGGRKSERRCGELGPMLLNEAAIVMAVGVNSKSVDEGT